MENKQTKYIPAGIFQGTLSHVSFFEDAWFHLNSKPKQYTSTQFCKEFLGDLPLEKVQKLLQTHYPENFI